MNQLISINNKPHNRKLSINKYKSRVIIYTVLLLLLTDWLYKTINGINPVNKQDCVLFNIAPRLIFLMYEYFVELILVVITGIFAGNLISKYFLTFKKVIPSNQLLAFVYASILPVCSCSVIPVIEPLKNKIKSRVLFTFIIAAPALNPYIIMLSFSTLGITYGVLRILSTFLLSITGGLFLEKVVKTTGNKYFSHNIFDCQAKSNQCPSILNTDIFQSTMKMTLKIFPYLLVAGFVGLFFEFFDPSKILQHHFFKTEWIGLVVFIFVGIPLYLCNGADVLFLYPLVNFAKLSMGTAIAFSLCSTMVCASSAIMLTQYIGKKATFYFITYIIIFTFCVGILINVFF